MLKIRCSALGSIMGNAEGKSNMEKYLEAKDYLKSETERYDNMKKKDGVNGIKLKKKLEDLKLVLPTLREVRNIITIPKGAQTAIMKIVKQEVFGYKTEISCKEMEKGTEVEQDSIDLYNIVNTTFYVKNEVRLSNDWIEGECDINGEDKIIDIKSAWSLETFPCTSEEIDNKGYEWQLRGYMWLYDKPYAEIAYCMVSTPNDLIPDWESDDIHLVDKHDEFLRVTKYGFERDYDKEDQIKKRVEACRQFYHSYKQQLLTKN